MYLFFDTETTGLPVSYTAPASAVQNWPRMVQLASLLFDGDGKLLHQQDVIIRPQGYTIPPAASKIHKITQERAMLEGKEIADALAGFQSLLSQSNLLVAHNMDFDERIIGCEFYRHILQDPLEKRNKVCTMKDKRVINFCALPSARPGSFKWPKLDELHRKLFGTGFEEAHNASVDIHATARCYFELKKRGVI